MTIPSSPADAAIKGPALLNSASLGEPSAQTLKVMSDHIALEARLGVANARTAVADELASAKQNVATLIFAAASDIAFTVTTTQGWSQIPIHMSLAHASNGTQTHPTSANNSYSALVAPAEWGPHIEILKRLGYTIEVMATTPDGQLDLPKIQNQITDKTRILAAPMVTSRTGFRYDLEGLGALSRPHDSAFVVDGAQAVGHVPVDVTKIGCDMFAATLRKWLRGPTGNAVLWTSETLRNRLPPHCLTGLGGMQWSDTETCFEDQPSAQRFNSYDASIPSLLGVGAAAKAALEGPVEARHQTIAERANRLQDHLRNHGAFVLRAPSATTGNVTFHWQTPEHDSAFFQRTADHGIAISHSLYQYEIMSHTPAQYGSDRPRNSPLLRVSAHADTPSEVLDQFEHLVSEFAATQSGASSTAA